MNFKKQLSFIIAFLVLFSNSGLAINVHYCADEIASISLDKISALEKEEDACCGVVEKDSKCCNDKIIKNESKSDHIMVKSLSISADFIAVVYDWHPLVFVPDTARQKTTKLTYSCDANAPPLFQLYCQYTFYA